MEEINPNSMISNRFFDQDMNNKGLVFLDVGCGIGRHLLILKNNRCLLYNTIEHCSEPNEVLREIYRILRKDEMLNILTRLTVGN